MSVVGDAKSLVDVLTIGWDWLRNRQSPFPRQAHRLLQAFGAHGIARQQIPRVLPHNLGLWKRRLLRMRKSSATA